jgi:Ca-activated chloride channel family protein
MEVRFNHLEALHWLWLVAALGVVIAVGFALRRRDLRRFASEAVLARLLPATSVGRKYTGAALVLLALVALVAALIDPRWGVTYRQVQQRGIDLVVILDVSRSMLAEDARPNRLQRAKQCPLTVDHGAFRLALATATPQAAPRGGSLLGDALRKASEVFTDDVPDHKAVIIFTDGEDHGSYPVEAAQRLHETLSIPVFTVGIGDSDEGARIPVTVDGQRVYLTYDGQEVWTKMNASALREIALTTGGAYVPLGTGSADIGRIYAERIDPLARREFDATTVKRHNPQYQWFAGFALLLLVAESLTGDRKTSSRTGART